MNKGGMFGKVVEFFDEITKSGKTFSRLDFGILKTLMMVAAVDGEIAREEMDLFKDIAGSCHGYSDQTFDDLWSEALHSAGYLCLQSRFLGKDELVAEFVKEAESAFVEEVSLEVTKEREHAFKCLDAMAKADGEYSEIEKACIDALARHVAEVRERAIAARFSRAATMGK